MTGPFFSASLVQGVQATSVESILQMDDYRVLSDKVSDSTDPQQKRVHLAIHPSCWDTTPKLKDETKSTPFGAHLRFCVLSFKNVVFCKKTAAEATLLIEYLSYELKIPFINIVSS
jgi:hypothetical protein